MQKNLFHLHLLIYLWQVFGLFDEKVKAGTLKPNLCVYCSLSHVRYQDYKILRIWRLNLMWCVQSNNQLVVFTFHDVLVSMTLTTNEEENLFHTSGTKNVSITSEADFLSENALCKNVVMGTYTHHVCIDTTDWVTALKIFTLTYTVQVCGLIGLN